MIQAEGFESTLFWAKAGVSCLFGVNPVETRPQSGPEAPIKRCGESFVHPCVSTMQWVLAWLSRPVGL